MPAHRVIIITGQTATGKTSLALTYKEHENGEIISADSRQIYTHLNIITGKDKEKIKSTVWMYDVVDPKEYFSSFDYKEKVLPLIDRLLNEGKTPVIVGGSYLYIKHLLYDIETERIPPDWTLRNQMKDKSVNELQELMKKLDIKTYEGLNQSDKNNPQRLIRKIEIASSKKIKQSGIKKHVSLFKKPDVTIQFIGLRFKKREAVKEQIQKRVEERLKQGAIEEVKSLLHRGYTAEDPGMKTIGYQQIIKYIKGEYTKDEAIQEWITKEIQYSKRQLTFMKKDNHIVWQEI